jgi:hypothetical protein
MTIPAVTVTIKDGALGILPGNTEGVHIKMGVCSGGTAGVLYALGDVATAIATLGHGPLTEAVCQALVSPTRGVAPQSVLAMKVAPSIAAVTGTVSYTRVGASTGTFATTGSSPVDAYQVKVLITRTGGAGVGAMRVSLDGGATYNPEVALAASYVVPNAGITLVLTGSLDAGDAASFDTKAPEFSAGDLNTAFTSLYALTTQFEFVHVVGAPQTGVDNTALVTASRTISDALAVQAATAEAQGRYIHIVTEMPSVTNDAAGDSALDAGYASFVSARVSCVAGYDTIVSAVSSRSYKRSAAYAYCARLSAIKAFEMPSATGLGPLTATSALGRDERVRTALDSKRFVTNRTHVGLQGFYVTTGRMMASAGSDFDLVTNRRVMDKASRIARASGLLFLDEALRANGPVSSGNNIQAGFPGAPGTIQDVEARRIESSILADLEAALSPGDQIRGDVSAIQVQVVRTNVILSDRTLRLKIRATPRGYARSIEIEIGFQSTSAV